MHRLLVSAINPSTINKFSTGKPNKPPPREPGQRL
jgi:hypothetical protein